LIGCSVMSLRHWLELQFRDGMTWTNHGTVWQVDHIKPRFTFDHADPAQRAICWHYSNLRPLLVSENRWRKDWQKHQLALPVHPAVAEQPAVRAMASNSSGLG